MSRLLVTGGAGFVGSSIALGIKQRSPKSTVIALDNLRRKGSELNLKRLHGAGIQFVHGDIRNPNDLDAVGGGDVLIECSAEPSAQAGYDGSPDYTVQTNVVGTYNCLEWARRHKADLIFFSSSRVYPIDSLNAIARDEASTRFEIAAKQDLPGVSTRGIAEDFPLIGHRSLYGATKLCSELLIAEYVAMYALRAVVNRCGLIAGPWQMGKIDQGVVVFWLAQHVYGKALRYIGYGGAGKQVRDVLHIDDLVDLTLLQLENIQGLSGEIFNVGGGRDNSISLLELTQIAQDLTGKKVSIEGVPETRPGDIPLYISDSGKIQKKLGWSPKRPVRKVCEDVTKWIREHETDLAPILAQ